MPNASSVEARRARTAAFATYCVDTGRGRLRPWLRRPLQAVWVNLDARRLPVLDATPGFGTEGRAVRRGLTRARPTRLPIDAVASVLELPATLEEYVQTPARRPVRRKVRVANRIPISWALVDDRDERLRLVAIANERERSHPDPLYRREQPDNGDLLDIRLWIAAYDPVGNPLMLAVLPIDGSWSVLRYFRTLTEGSEASVARYLLTEVVVGELISRGVRWLGDTESPFVLPNGLRHFQKMVGYELFRLRLRSPQADAGVAEPADDAADPVTDRSERTLAGAPDAP